MRKVFLLSAIALLAAVGCSKNESPELQDGSDEIAVAPFNGNAALRTKGYSEGPIFYETLRANLHSTTEGDHNAVARKMQLSAYLYPQNGEQKNYFVGKTYAKGEGDTYWRNYNGTAVDPIYWPVGGTMDFLAYSLSGEPGASKNVTAVWNKDNAAKQVVLTVPGENTQNDILFASAAGIKSSAKAPVDMQFNHAQAWLEFALTGAPAGIVHLQKIELENVYNAGTLTISNNAGNAVATWDFKGEDRQNIAVDNFNTSKDLTSAPMYLDMLIPQQTKTNFVLYYTLGSDTKVLQYRFGTDLKTWLMGEKYVYNIAISTSEVTVSPTVTSWEPAVIETSYTVAIPTKIYAADGIAEIGAITHSFSPDNAFTKEDEESTYDLEVYTCDTWGAQVALKAEATAPAVFVKWSDGNTENPRTFTIYEDVELPEALFGYEVITTTKTADAARCIETTYKIVAGKSGTVKAVPAEGYKFYKWYSDAALATPLESGEGITVNKDEITIDSVNKKLTYYAKFIPQEAIAAEFSVSANKKVFFSPGNLQASITKNDTEPVTYTANSWNFAEHQYDYIGESNVSETDLASTIDLFGWSADGGNAEWGISTSKKLTDYGDSSEDVLNDWGKNMPIGGYDNIWRTMTGDYSGEWKYLLDIRTVNGGTGNGYSYQRCTISGVFGMLIYPDGYTNQTASPTSIPEGCVFLPAAGFRQGSAIYVESGIYGYYWSSTPYSDIEAYYPYFYKYGVYPSNNMVRFSGYSVRLVTEL